MLTDKLYCSYFLVALLLKTKCDLIVRLHGARKVDFSKSKRLGNGDRLVTWKRPAKPQWMDQQTFDQMPESLKLRLVEVQVNEPGFPTDTFLVVTTLLNPKEYPAVEIADLYRIALARRIGYSRDQGAIGDGCVAVQNSSYGAQGDLDLPVGL